ncbi:MAG: M48 family metalloprotease, partial [Planctomycetales bacterium]|nr:M48 family metalloprotease [Planctomycetales bacterium]
MSVVERVLSHPLSEVVGWSLVHFVWQGAAITLLLAIALRGMRRSSASARYLIACAALTMMAVCPVLTAGWLARDLEWPAELPAPIRSVDVVVPDVAQTEHDIAPEISDEGWHAQSAAMGVARTHDVEPATPFQGVPPDRPLRERVVTAIKPALPWMVGVWLMGVSLLSGRLLMGWVEVQRLRRSAIQSVGKSYLETLRQLAARLRVSRPVRLVESALVEVPTVVGWLRPMILLPASAITGLTADQLQAVLAHELAHIRRHDYLVNLLQTVAETLLFYHPAVWWVSHRIRLEREHCCDDIAVQICGDRVAYARMLVTLETLRTPVRLAMTASGGSLLARISRLVGGRPTPHTNRTTWWLAGVLAMTTVAGLGLGLYVTSRADDSPAAINSEKNGDLRSSDQRGQETRAEQVALFTQPAPTDEAVGKPPRDASLDVVAEFADAAYARPTADDQRATATIPAEAWGEPVDGLRVAILLRSPPIDKDGRLRYDIVAENVSDHDIRFSVTLGVDDWHNFCKTKLADADGKQLVQQEGTHLWLRSTLKRLWLKPKERGVISSWASGLFRQDETGQPVDRPDGYRGPWYFKVKPGRYSVSAAVELGPSMYSVDPASKKRTVLSPAKGEWSGKLQTGAAPLTIAAPRDGLGFLTPNPKLHGLSLDMTEPQFLEIVKQQELKTRKSVEGEKVTHHIGLGDDYTLIVMFDKDGKCRGIQRVRGEDDAPLETATPIRSDAGPGNDRKVRFDDFPAPAEFEELRPRHFKPTTLTWEDILRRLKSEEQKYETLEVLTWMNQQASQDGGREVPQAETRERMVRVKEDSYCVKTTVFTDHQFRREEVVRGRWWLRRHESPSQPNVAARNETLVLPANHHRLAPHCLASGAHLEDVVQTLSWKLTEGTPDKRLLVEVLGEEVLQSERCVKLRATEAALPDSPFQQLFWLSLDHNLLPMRWEFRTRDNGRVLLLVRTVPNLFTIGEGVAFPKRVQSYFVSRTPEASEFKIETLNTIVVAKATLKPQIPDGMFDKLGQPPKQDPPTMASSVPDRSVRLADVVRDFNAENTQLGRGLDQPVLTDDKVIAAIKSDQQPPELRMLRTPALLLPDHWIMQAVGFDNDGKELVTASTQSFVTIRRWDVVGMKLISEIKLQADQHGRTFREGTLMFSGDQRRVVAATDAYVGIWETATGKLLKQLPFKTKEGVYDCAIDMLDCTPDLSVIVGHRALPGRLTLSYDAHVIVWDGVSGNVLQTVIDKGATDLKALDLSTDGKRLVTTNGSGAKIWETSTGKLLRSIPNDNTGSSHVSQNVGDVATSPRSGERGY